MKKRVIYVAVTVIILAGLLWFFVPGKFAGVLESKIYPEEIQRISITKMGSPFELSSDTTEITEPEQISEFYKNLEEISVLRWFSHDTHQSTGEKKAYDVYIEGKEQDVNILFFPSSAPWYYLVIDGGKEYICWE